MFFPKDPLRYRNTWLAACRWTSFELCMNWLITLTTYAISDLVWERYMSLPTRHWYISLSTITSSFASSSLWLGSIGVFVGLHANFPVSLKRFVTYFYWEIKIPYLEGATSTPRNSNSLNLKLLGQALSQSLSLIFIISHRNDVVYLKESL